jgi:predicted exporter
MLAGLHRLHAWLVTHLAVTVFVSLALLLGGLSLLRGGTTEQDLGAMLPGGPGSPREAAQLLSEFGALDTLLIDLEVPGTTEEQLAQEGRTLAEGLRNSGLFQEVFTGPSLQDVMAVSQVLLPRRLYFLEEPAAEIHRRLEPKFISQRLQTLKAQLALPQAMMMKQDLLRDPLGLNADLLAGLTNLAGNIRPSNGQLLSQDGRHLLLVTTPLLSALDARATSILLTTVARETGKLPAGPAGPPVVTAVGGPRFALESTRAVRRDVVVTMLCSLAGLILLFILRFRDLRLLLLVSVPVGFGMVGGLAGVVLVQGHIHPLTFAFGSVLMGIGIDYPLYLLNAASVHQGGPLERMSAGLDETWRSLWLGFLTTIIAFVMMTLSQFPGLRELALFAGGGIVTSFAVTLILLVPLCAAWGPRRWSGIPRWMPAFRTQRVPNSIACVVALVVLGAAAALMPALRFDGELRHLDAQSPQTLAEFRQVMDRFGLRAADSLIVARGPTVQDALSVNDAVGKVLRVYESKAAVGGVLGVGKFLPAVATQQARAKQLVAMNIAQEQSRLSAAAVEQGFAPTAFEAFWTEVSDVRAGRVSPLTPANFDHTSLESLFKRLVKCSAQGCIAVTAFQPRDAAQVPALSKDLPASSVLLDAHALAEQTVARIPRQLALLSGLGLALNVLLLAFAYRSLKLAVLACLPGCIGLGSTIAILAAVHVPLNMVSASALVLILGCGVDYGIFALQGLTSPSSVAGVESTGVVLTSLTALAGFGTLVLASYKALQFLGAAVGLGIILSASAAILLLPGLFNVLGPRLAKAQGPP